MKPGFGCRGGTGEGTHWKYPKEQSFSLLPLQKLKYFLLLLQLRPLWLLSHCLCFHCAFLSNSPITASALILPLMA